MLCFYFPLYYSFVGKVYYVGEGACLYRDVGVDVHA